MDLCCKGFVTAELTFKVHRTVPRQQLEWYVRSRVQPSVRAKGFGLAVGSVLKGEQSESLGCDQLKCDLLWTYPQAP